MSLFLQLRDITGIEQQSHALARPWWPYIASLAAVLLTSLFFVGWRYYRRNSHRTKIRAGPWALSELKRIEELSRSADSVELQRYVALLSEVVRTYLEKRFQLRAPQQTTAEFLRDTEQSTILSPSQQELLRQFLERCDLSKFAHLEFSQEEYRALEETARKFVEQTAEG